MLARDRFQTETPNVIDPGECPPSRPSRPKEGAENGIGSSGDCGRDRTSRRSSLVQSRSRSEYGNSRGIKNSLYTRNGNKGALSRGIPIRCDLDVNDNEDDDDDASDDVEEVVVFESPSMAYKRELSVRDERKHNRSRQRTKRNRFFIDEYDDDDDYDEEESGIAQARLFAAAMLNESEKRQLSMRNLMSGNNDDEVPPSSSSRPTTALRQMMTRASSFRNPNNPNRKTSGVENRTASMATARASSLRNLGGNRPRVNRALSNRHISLGNGNSNSNHSTIDEKHLVNIWLVDDVPDVLKAGPGSFKTKLLRLKLVKARILLVFGIVIVTVFVLAAVNGTATSGSSNGVSSSGDSNSNNSNDNGNLATAVTISMDPRLDKIVGFLTDTTSISSVKDLYDSSSPQFRAARWLADEDSERLTVPTITSGTGAGVGDLYSFETGVTANAVVVSPFDFVQRYILLVLYFALGGNNNTNDNDSSWTNGYLFASRDRHECSWYERVLQSDKNKNNDSNEMNVDQIQDAHYVAMGVACDTELRVRSISLASNNLMGSIPSEIQYLSALDSLDLSNNSLVGSIPEYLRNLVHLTHLDLSTNRLTGEINPLYWLGKEWTQLEFLDLSNNLLDLDRSGQSHNRRSCFGEDTRLTTLRLGGNTNANNINRNDDDDKTMVSIPNEIRCLTNLRELSLDNSNIGGRIPAWIFHELDKLQFLDLSHNQLTGSVRGAFPSAGVYPLPLQDLQSLLLHDNELTGTLPDSVGLMPNLTTVTIHHTNMTVGTETANSICWREEESSTLESLTTDCGDVTCPCCLEDCCDSKDCYRDVDWQSLSTHHQSESNKDEGEDRN